MEKKTFCFEDDECLTVVDLKHYSYCPRIIYFTHVLHLQEKETEAMSYGRETQDESSLAPLIKLLKAEKVTRDLPLQSRTIPLKGKLDYLIHTKLGEHIPVELKWAEPTLRGKAKPDHKVQLIAYALMIDENIGTTVKRGAIYYRKTNKIILTPITCEDKNRIKEMTRTIVKIIMEENYPKLRPNKKQCVNCGFFKFCKPRLTDINNLKL
ncbi:MAG: CRISPR-associated protein Cas4 [Candidatus Bathyarchaeia archaeon]